MFTRFVNFRKILGPAAVTTNPTAIAPHKSFTVTLMMNWLCESLAIRIVTIMLSKTAESMPGIHLTVAHPELLVG